MPYAVTWVSHPRGQLFPTQARKDFPMYKWVCLTFALAIAAPAVASAADNRGIYAAADKYRSAVVLFEKVVQNTRGVERVDEKLVDRFEEATKRMRSAARNPQHANRLRYEWAKIQPLQMQVERTMFNKYTLNHQLFESWREVLYCADVFYEEYLFQLDNPRHGNSVQRRPMRSRPDRFIPPPPAASGRLYRLP